MQNKEGFWMELQLEHLSKTYGTVQALKDISYTFKPGIYGILGANGAGKSTMINLITDNVARDKGSAGGSILYDGQDILKLGSRFRGIIGYMPQQQGFYEDFSPKAFLRYMAEIKGIKGKNEKGQTVKEQIDELLEVVNLTGVAYKKIGGFSGGMKQRVLLAQALLGDPDILILDEPTTGLDPQTRRLIWNVISSFRKDENMTVFLTTHYMEEAAEADYVVIIDDGKISAEGTPLELKNIYTGDYITIYDVDEKDIKALDVEYEQIRNGYRLSVPNTKATTELIIRNPQLFNDYEITKGKMDDVFLAVTGKTLVGGAEK